MFAIKRHLSSNDDCPQSKRVCLQAINFSKSACNCKSVVEHVSHHDLAFKKTEEIPLALPSKRSYAIIKQHSLHVTDENEHYANTRIKRQKFESKASGLESFYNCKNWIVTESELSESTKMMPFKVKGNATKKNSVNDDPQFNNFQFWKIPVNDIMGLDESESMDEISSDGTNNGDDDPHYNTFNYWKLPLPEVDGLM